MPGHQQKSEKQLQQAAKRKRMKRLPNGSPQRSSGTSEGGSFQEDGFTITADLHAM